MPKNKGIRLRRKLVRQFKRYILRRTRRRTGSYELLEPSAGPISKLRRWVQSLRRAARSICGCGGGGKPNSGYIQLGGEAVAPPKGHLAVYVGEKESSICRVVVPVLYFNHPLFGSLLREAEKVYGFDHPGGIQIPCPKSELDTVQMKIAAASGGGIWPRTSRRLMDHRDSFLWYRLCFIAPSLVFLDFLWILAFFVQDFYCHVHFSMLILSFWNLSFRF